MKLYNNEYVMGFGTLITIFLFELTNIYTIKKIIKHQGILHYIKAWNHTILNSTLLGSFVYKQITIHLHNKNNSIIYNFINIQKILFIHSIGYWFVHKLMHTKTLWCIHKYHHSYLINQIENRFLHTSLHPNLRNIFF